jgi:hypothetical protein
MQRLWLTIVNNETAKQGVKRGRNGAVMCALFFAGLAVDGWWHYNGQGAEVLAFFSALYIFAAWRIHRGSAALMDFAMIFLPFGIHAAYLEPAMRPGGYWSGIAWLFVLFGFELLNGVRGVSYLQAPLGLRREDGGASRGIGAATDPESPLRPKNARVPGEI